MYKGKKSEDNILIDSYFNKAVASVLKELRIKNDYSLSELSNKMNNYVSRQTLNRYELGLSKVRIDIFEKLSSIYGIPQNELFNIINVRYMGFISETNLETNRGEQV